MSRAKSPSAAAVAAAAAASMPRLLLCLLLLSFALLTSGCASGGGLSSSPDQTETIEELKRRVLDLQREAAVNREEIDRLETRVAELEERRITPPPPPAPPAETVEPFQPAVIDESDLDFPETEPAPRPAPVAPPSREPARRVEAIPSTPVVEMPETGGRPAAADVGTDGQALYDRGYTLYHQGRYREAEDHFRQFLAAHGSTDLADNAQYWIGESLYARKDYEGALAAFRATVEQFPNGNKVPDALLKAGQCFEAMGDVDGARQTYEEISRSYPQSAASARAAERIQRLR